MDFEKSYDVVVAGAGVAGAAAALEAARAGLKVALLEKTIFTGGLATTGLVNIYLPLCDGNGRQVLFGMAEELLHVSARYGPGDVPPLWRESPVDGKYHRYRLTFSSASFTLALDELLEQAGVDLWLDTLACVPIMEGDRVAGVEVENKSGRGALHAKCVVDATGDADIAYRAGCECASGENFSSVWIFQASLATARKVAESGNGPALMDAVRLAYNGEWFDTQPERRRWDATDGKDVTGFVLETHRLLREHYAKQHAEGGDKDRHNLYPLTLPAMAQFRKTRRIVGKATLTDGQDGQSFADSIGLSGDWRKPGPIWEIPYGTLVPPGHEGLLAAGRCISTEGDAWEVLRVIPPAAHTGQVAGLAATMAVRNGTVPSRVPAEEIQRELRAKGIPYHLEEVV